MKHFIYITLIIIASLTSYWIGTQTWYFDINNKPHHFNTEKARLAEVKYGNAMFEALHWWYERYPILWEETFKNTKEYKNMEIANEGNWEDFYLDWNKK